MVMQMEKGCIFQIQRYCIHDGDGIRTTVFLKGCPLRCKWCANPESQSFEPEILFRSENCTGCGECVRACRYGAISQQNGRIFRHVLQCRHCGACAQACIYHAANAVGQMYTVEQVVQMCKRDLPFYRQSGGGVTLSGGEPFAQPAFVQALLRRLREEEISTAVETTGFAPTQVLMNSDVDQFLYDFKCLDTVRHQSLTGVSNELILNNLEQISMCRSVTIRMPLIPTCNMDDELLQRTGAYFSKLTIPRVHLLAYHTLGEGKYDRLGRSYPMGAVRPPDKAQMEYARHLLSKYVPEVQIIG